MAKHTVTTSGTVVVSDGDTVKVQIAGGGDVTIEADPTDNVDKVKIEFLDDSHADFITIDLSTFSEDDLHIDIKKYDPSDSIRLLGAFNTYIDPNHPDEYRFEYIGSDGLVHTGFLHAKDGGEKDFTTNPITIVCFAAGTLIDTPVGPVKIEHLEVGDLVETLDNGPQPIRYIGRRHINGWRFALQPDLRPILFRKDAFGTGLPNADLHLSPNHRVLLNDWRAEMLFGTSEVLVSAKHLVNDHKVTKDRLISDVTYFHLLFDQHEVVVSNGLASESLFLGADTLDTLERDSVSEIHSLFPELSAGNGFFAKCARPVLRSFEASALLAYG